MRTEEATVEVVGADQAALAIPDQVYDEVIEGIRAAWAKHGFALVQDVGRIVVEKFYGGDVGVMRDRGQKDASLRKLAEHPELPMSAATLYRTVATYEVVNRLGGVATWKHLEPSHVRAVLPLPEKDQRRLLERADERAWTVRQLEEEARKARAKAKKGNVGRPALPRFVKSIHALERFVEDEEAFADLSDEVELDGEEAKRLYQVVTGLKLKCAELQERLQGKVPGFGRMEN